MNNIVNVVFLYRDGRGEDNLVPKCEIFKKCKEAGCFGDSPANIILGPTGKDRDHFRMLVNDRGDQVNLVAAFAAYADRINGKTLSHSTGNVDEWVLECLGIEPAYDFGTKTVFINCMTRDNGNIKVALENAISRYSNFMEPIIALADELDLVADPYRAYHYARPYIEAKIRTKYGQAKQEHGFSHAAEQLLIGALNGAVERDDRTEMVKLGLIFEAASAMLRI